MPEYIEALFAWENVVALLTLTALEIVLGIDNVIFIAILTDKLPEGQRAKARNAGLSLAAITRILLLFSISWVMSLKQELFSVFGLSISGKSLILLGGGLFLIAKATYEIHHNIEDDGHAGDAAAKAATSFATVIAQVLMLDIVFSLDSVITAVGMVPPEAILVMVLAILISVGVMIGYAGPVSRFVQQHPTMRMLALAFLVLIGVMLVVEGTGHHVSKGYIYFAMGFSFVVELLNMKVRKRRQRAAAAHA